MMKDKMVVLITCEQNYSSAARNLHYKLDKAYAKMVSDAGDIPITPLSSVHTDEYCQLADALLLTGGININPRYYHDTFYGKQYVTNYSQDWMEMHLLQEFFKAGKPIVGIGRGMQLINVALGGSLIQNLMEQQGKKHNLGYHHRITIEKDTLLYNVLGESCIVNSQHDQAIDRLGKGLKAAAFSSDGVIEAIEHVSKPVFGVQYHPEVLVWDKRETIDGEKEHQKLVNRYLHCAR